MNIWLDPHITVLVIAAAILVIVVASELVGTLLETFEGLLRFFAELITEI